MGICSMGEVSCLIKMHREYEKSKWRNKENSKKAILLIPKE